jgi:hypothetical protein
LRSFDRAAVLKQLDPPHPAASSTATTAEDSGGSAQWRADEKNRHPAHREQNNIAEAKARPEVSLLKRGKTDRV